MDEDSRIETRRAARQVLLAGSHGVLSTHSVDVPGYPFGSVVPYVLDGSGIPVILIANIAQHTRNVAADPRVSLIVLQEPEVAGDVQAAGRLTLLADAARVPLEDDDTAARYYESYPDALDYHRTHGFYFYRLAPVRVRYIGGFGRIHWLPPAEVLRSNPFPWPMQRSMIEHMNADHVDAMRGYAARAGHPVPDEITPALVGVDAEGLHLRLGYRLLRIDFPRAVTTPAEVRAALVALARATNATPAGSD